LRYLYKGEGESSFKGTGTVRAHAIWFSKRGWQQKGEREGLPRVTNKLRGALGARQSSTGYLERTSNVSRVEIEICRRGNKVLFFIDGSDRFSNSFTHPKIIKM
jgi:hypothetical protein